MPTELPVLYMLGGATSYCRHVTITDRSPLSACAGHGCPRPRSSMSARMRTSWVFAHVAGIRAAAFRPLSGLWASPTRRPTAASTATVSIADRATTGVPGEASAGRPPATRGVLDRDHAYPESAASSACPHDDIRSTHRLGLRFQEGRLEPQGLPRADSIEKSFPPRDCHGRQDVDSASICCTGATSTQSLSLGL
jgi:hypothetical protein